MATKCIDISDNKNIGSNSPLSIFAFVAIFILLTAVMKTGIVYFILLMVAFIFTQVFFQYKPRYIFLTIKFLGKNSYLTPSFTDRNYLSDETRIPEIVKILNEYEYQEKAQRAGRRRHANRK
jgi:hypothetical protein